MSLNGDLRLSSVAPNMYNFSQHGIQPFVNPEIVQGHFHERGNILARRRH